MPGAWKTRGLPAFKDAQRCIRCDTVKDQTNGFFVACFERVTAKERKSWKRKAEKAELDADLPDAKKQATEDDGDELREIDPETIKLAQGLGQAQPRSSRERFKADPDDPENYPVVCQPPPPPLPPPHAALFLSPLQCMELHGRPRQLFGILMEKVCGQLLLARVMAGKPNCRAGPPCWPVWDPAVTQTGLDGTLLERLPPL